MKYVQFVPLVIDDYESMVMDLPLHTHTYYEMIYIHKGKGKHTLNGSTSNYREGDIFLMCPSDEHVIAIEVLTHFTVIKFTTAYLTEHELDGKELDRIVALMHNTYVKEFKPILGPPFDTIFKNSIENLVLCNKLPTLSSSNWVFYQFLSMMDILIHHQSDEGLATKQSGEELLEYIHNNMYTPQNLQIKKMAVHFNKSPLYFSYYFKKKYGKTLREYTQNYRLQLIENRLKNSSYTIKQIAQEFGFYDKSHLYHFLKSINHVNPGVFRQLKNLQKED